MKDKNFREEIILEEVEKYLSKYVSQPLPEQDEKFTIAEIKNYLYSEDSRGDILYNLSAKNIIKANSHIEKED